MGFPLVSIIWVNYNSSKFIEVIIDSLESIANLDYPRYETIVVDNGSTDGSFTVVKNISNKYNFKLVKLHRNLGFTGGNNMGFKARNKESKYVALINNDAIVFKDSLRELVEFMENEEAVGAAQGIILSSEGVIDSAGVMMDEVLASHPLYRYKSPGMIKRPLAVTYTSGAYSIYRVTSLLDVWDGMEKIFFDFGFGYFDDNVLGLQMWNHGWKCRVYPVNVGVHKSSLSFGRASSLRAYLSLRNTLLLNEITNSRYKSVIPLFALRDAFPRAFRSKDKFYGCIAYAIRDYERLKPFLVGYRLDIYRAPVVKIEPWNLIKFLGLRRKVTHKIDEELSLLFKDT
jgi:GT2 family glycosyltransferase